VKETIKTKVIEKDIHMKRLENDLIGMESSFRDLTAKHRKVLNDLDNVKQDYGKEYITQAAGTLAIGVILAIFNACGWIDITWKGIFLPFVGYFGFPICYVFRAEIGLWFERRWLRTKRLFRRN
jgi:hypothetical protein